MVAAVAAGAVGGRARALPVVDTVKQVDEDGLRGEHARALGPARGADAPGLPARRAGAGARRRRATATDDAGLVERLGERVLVVAGDPRALKVTTPADLEAAARLLAAT